MFAVVTLRSYIYYCIYSQAATKDNLYAFLRSCKGTKVRRRY